FFRTNLLQSITIHLTSFSGIFEAAARVTSDRQQQLRVKIGEQVQRFVAINQALADQHFIDLLAANHHLVQYAILSQNTSRLTFENSFHLNNHLQHVHLSFPYLQELRLERCGVSNSGNNLLDASFWDLERLQLDITNMRERAALIQINTAATQTRLFNDVDRRYEVADPNQAVGNHLTISARTL
ncbi:hypothetical protein MBANPS3_010747, partial [Mucor bainieri]